MLNRREVLPSAVAAALAPMAAGAGLALPRGSMPDPWAALADPWVRLCREREGIFRIVENSVAGGDIPDEIAGPAWARVADIDAEIAASAPSTQQGLAAVLRMVEAEMRGGSMPDENLVYAVFVASLQFIEGGRS